MSAVKIEAAIDYCGTACDLAAPAADADPGTRPPRGLDLVGRSRRVDDRSGCCSDHEMPPRWTSGLDMMARGVWTPTPWHTDQRRADALGALAAGAERLACACGTADCPAAERRPVRW